MSHAFFARRKEKENANHNTTSSGSSDGGGGHLAPFPTTNKPVTAAASGKKNCAIVGMPATAASVTLHTMVQAVTGDSADGEVPSSVLVLRSTDMSQLGACDLLALCRFRSAEHSNKDGTGNNNSRQSNQRRASIDPRLVLVLVSPGNAEAINFYAHVCGFSTQPLQFDVDQTRSDDLMALLQLDNSNNDNDRHRSGSQSEASGDNNNAAIDAALLRFLQRRRQQQKQQQQPSHSQQRESIASQVLKLLPPSARTDLNRRLLEQRTQFLVENSDSAATPSFLFTTWPPVLPKLMLLDLSDPLLSRRESNAALAVAAAQYRRLTDRLAAIAARNREHKNSNNKSAVSIRTSAAAAAAAAAAKNDVNDDDDEPIIDIEQSYNALIIDDLSSLLVPCAGCRANSALERELFMWAAPTTAGVLHARFTRTATLTSLAHLWRLFGTVYLHNDPRASGSFLASLFACSNMSSNSNSFIVSNDLIEEAQAVLAGLDDDQFAVVEFAEGATTQTLLQVRPALAPHVGRAQEAGGPVRADGSLMLSMSLVAAVLLASQPQHQVGAPVAPSFSSSSALVEKSGAAAAAAASTTAEMPQEAAAQPDAQEQKQNAERGSENKAGDEEVAAGEEAEDEAVDEEAREESNGPDDGTMPTAPQLLLCRIFRESRCIKEQQEQQQQNSSASSPSSPAAAVGGLPSVNLQTILDKELAPLLRICHDGRRLYGGGDASALREAGLVALRFCWIAYDDEAGNDMVRLEEDGLKEIENAPHCFELVRLSVAELLRDWKQSIRHASRDRDSDVAGIIHRVVHGAAAAAAASATAATMNDIGAAAAAPSSSSAPILSLHQQQQQHVAVLVGKARMHVARYLCAVLLLEDETGNSQLECADIQARIARSNLFDDDPATLQREFHEIQIQRLLQNKFLHVFHRQQQQQQQQHNDDDDDDSNGGCVSSVSLRRDSPLVADLRRLYDCKGYLGNEASAGGGGGGGGGGDQHAASNKQQSASSGTVKQLPSGNVLVLGRIRRRAAIASNGQDHCVAVELSTLASECQALLLQLGRAAEIDAIKHGADPSAILAAHELDAVLADLLRLKHIRCESQKVVALTLAGLAALRSHSDMKELGMETPDCRAYIAGIAREQEGAMLSDRIRASNDGNSGFGFSPTVELCLRVAENADELDNLCAPTLVELAVKLESLIRSQQKSPVAPRSVLLEMMRDSPDMMESVFADAVNQGLVSIGTTTTTSDEQQQMMSITKMGKNIGRVAALLHEALRHTVYRFSAATQQQKKKNNKNAIVAAAAAAATPISPSRSSSPVAKVSLLDMTLCRIFQCAPYASSPSGSLQTVATDLISNREMKAIRSLCTADDVSEFPGWRDIADNLIRRHKLVGQDANGDSLWVTAEGFRRVQELCQNRLQLPATLQRGTECPLQQLAAALRNVDGAAPGEEDATGSAEAEDEDDYSDDQQQSGTAASAAASASGAAAAESLRPYDYDDPRNQSNHVQIACITPEYLQQQQALIEASIASTAERDRILMEQLNEVRFPCNAIIRHHAIVAAHQRGKFTSLLLALLCRIYLIVKKRPAGEGDGKSVELHLALAELERLRPVCTGSAANRQRGSVIVRMGEENGLWSVYGAIISLNNRGQELASMLLPEHLIIGAPGPFLADPGTFVVMLMGSVQFVIAAAHALLLDVETRADGSQERTTIYRGGRYVLLCYANARFSVASRTGQTAAENSYFNSRFASDDIDEVSVMRPLLLWPSIDFAVASGIVAATMLCKPYKPTKSQAMLRDLAFPDFYNTGEHYAANLDEIVDIFLPTVKANRPTRTPAGMTDSATTAAAATARNDDDDAAANATQRRQQQQQQKKPATAAANGGNDDDGSAAAAVVLRDDERFFPRLHMAIALRLLQKHANAELTKKQINTAYMEVERYCEERGSQLKSCLVEMTRNGMLKATPDAKPLRLAEDNDTLATLDKGWVRGFIKFRKYYQADFEKFSVKMLLQKAGEFLLTLSGTEQKTSEAQ